MEKYRILPKYATGTEIQHKMVKENDWEKIIVSLVPRQVQTVQ